LLLTMTNYIITKKSLQALFAIFASTFCNFKLQN